MTKREKILKIFNDAEWINNSPSFRSKIITYDMFKSAGLGNTIEYQEKYCDVIYARHIFNKMGYRTSCGLALHVYDFLKTKL